MNLAVMSIGLSLAAAPPANADEAVIEDWIRAELAPQGEVLQVEMTRRDADHMTGFADIRDNEGREGRLNCSAQRTEGADFQVRCLPAITEQILREMEDAIRTSLAEQAEVLEIAMRRQDDMRMAGFARLRDADGTEVRANCTAVRENPQSRTFDWECEPEE